MFELANLLFPNLKYSRNDLINKYPKRKNVATRFAPSPTGFLHIGGVFTALVCRKIADKYNGVFYLRIEDTDKKREVSGSKELIVDLLNKFNITIDEGIDNKGIYGPYTQSERIDIYHVFAHYLVEKGYAYPCFATEEELNEIRERQVRDKKNPGYYKEYAIYRDKSFEEYKDLLKKNQKFVLRFRVPDNVSDRVGFNDLIKGYVEFENNYNDFVLLKENGIPTYHFAHAVDDYLMRTSHVIRGDEWLSSVPVHLQLFNALDFEVPNYAHVSPIMKIDGESRRKLSKRKDVEASFEYYLKEGYPIEAIKIYLLTLINSNFEEWYLNNNDYESFEVDFDNMSKSGALYDLEKLNHYSAEVLYKKNDYNDFLSWAKEYDLELYDIVSKDINKLINIFATQGENSHEKRKDLFKYNMFLDVFGYFYNEIFDNIDFNLEDALKEVIDINLAKKVVPEIIDNLDLTIKEITDKLGFVNKKKYEKDPTLYKGTNVEFFKLMRLLVTKRESGISLDDTIKILGVEEVKRRLSFLI